MRRRCRLRGHRFPQSEQDNGLKFFQSGGTKLTEKFERELDDEFDVVAESGELDFPEISDTASDRLEMYSAAILKLVSKRHAGREADRPGLRMDP